MSNFSSLINPQIPIIKHFHPMKLLEPVYIKNHNRQRNLSQSNATENHRQVTQKQHTSQSNDFRVNQSFRLAKDLINDQEFGLRNFGHLCDKGQLENTSFHLVQKFGRRARVLKLNPLIRKSQGRPNQYGRNLVTNNIMNTYPSNNKFLSCKGINEPGKQEEEIIVIQDKRYFLKKIAHLGNFGFVILFKSFSIAEVKSFNDNLERPNKQKQLQIEFSLLQHIVSLEKLEDILHFFQNNLEVVSNGKIKINQKKALQIEIDKTIRIDLPEKLFIENKHGDRFFQITFPRIELYMPETAYNQTIFLKSCQVQNIIDKNLDNYEEFLNKFDQKAFQSYWQEKMKQRVENNGISIEAKEMTLPDREKIEKKQKSTLQTEQNNNPSQVKQISQQSESKNVQTKTLQDLSYQGDKKLLIEVIIEEKEGNTESYWTRNILQQICEYEQEKYIVNFCPTKIVLKEKISNRIVKLAFPTFSQFTGLLAYSLNHELEYFCKNSIDIVSNLDSLELRFEMFRRHLAINVQWPDPNHEIEIGESSLENGIFQLWTTEVEINNKDFVIELQQDKIL